MLTNDVRKNIIPTPLQVLIYFDQKGFSEAEAINFYAFFDSNNWVGKKGSPIKNWRVKASEWMWQLQKKHSYQRSKRKISRY
ncbi:MAG: hypothetical protein H7Y07_06980 [Pyrinomonadaceae bacterium]|nr:hypothetical protein [Sphingobacteriaceae bacterium]